MYCIIIWKGSIMLLLPFEYFRSALLIIPIIHPVYTMNIYIYIYIYLLSIPWACIAAHVTRIPMGFGIETANPHCSPMKGELKGLGTQFWVTQHASVKAPSFHPVSFRETTKPSFSLMILKLIVWSLENFNPMLLTPRPIFFYNIAYWLYGYYGFYSC